MILGILAYIVSLGFARSAGFFERALYAYTIYGASITPSLVAALFWKGATKAGAVSSSPPDRPFFPYQIGRAHV